MKLLLPLLAILLTLTPPLLADERQVIPIDFNQSALPDDGFGRVVVNGETMPRVQELFQSESHWIKANVAPERGPYVIPLFQIDNPPLTRNPYGVLGTVWYQNVEGVAYLELCSEFSDGRRSSSRTQADSGPMMRIAGTSVDRTFRLAAEANPGQTPKRLTLNLVLPGRGAVIVKHAGIMEEVPTPATAPAVHSLLDVPTPAQVEAELAKHPATDLQKLIDERDQMALMVPSLRQQDDDAHPMQRRMLAMIAGMNRRAIALGGPALPEALDPERASGPTTAPAGRQDLAAPPVVSVGADRLLRWASDHFAAVFLTLVALSLASTIPLRWLIKHGRGRGIVLGCFGLMMLAGVGELFAAGVAFGMDKSTDAWATLLGGSAILIVVPGMMLRQMERQYAGMELRKMRAMDVA